MNYRLTPVNPDGERDPDGEFYLIREVDPIRAFEKSEYQTALKKIKALKSKIKDILDK